MTISKKPTALISTAAALMFATTGSVCHAQTSDQENNKAVYDCLEGKLPGLTHADIVDGKFSVIVERAAPNDSQPTYVTTKYIEPILAKAPPSLWLTVNNLETSHPYMGLAGVDGMQGLASMPIYNKGSKILSMLLVPEEKFSGPQRKESGLIQSCISSSYRP